MEVLARRSVKVKICAAPKRERSVEEEKRNQIFNPQKSLKLKYSRRSGECLATNYKNDDFTLGSTNTKSNSLPPSPNSIICVPSSITVTEEPKKCNCNSSGLSVSVNDEKEKELITKLRDELRNSPLLNCILMEKLNANK